MKKKLMKAFLLAAFCLLVFGSVASAKSPAVASIGSKKYNSLEKALKAVKNGQTIKLQKDVTAEGEIVSKKNVKFTLDMNKHTITNANEITYTDVAAAKGVLCIQKGKVTLKNGTVHDAVRVEKEAKLTIQSGIYEQLLNRGTTVVNKATFLPKVGAAIFNDGKGKLTINNVTVKSAKSVLWQLDGTAVIKQGTFQSLDEEAQYHAVRIDKGKLTIQGGSFLAENDCVLGILGGKATVTGGSFINNSSSKVVVYAASGANLTIKGGNFSAKKDMNLLGVEGSVRVDGGTFTSNWSHPLMFTRNNGKLTLARNVRILGSNDRIYNESGSVTLNGKTYTTKGGLYNF